MIRTIALGSFALAVGLGAAVQALGQDAKASYPTMAPLDQYLIADRNAEIGLARSAAPESITKSAEILVLGEHGYASAVAGSNGFVCLVQRSWTAGTEDPEFWNSKLRAPICLNEAAARSYLRLVIKKTDWALAGQSKAQIADHIKAAYEKKELPAMEAGAMAYMLSKQQYVSDQGGHWHPHLMFFVPQTEVKTWGANMPGSPILASEDATERIAIFMIPVSRWSDGTAEGMH
jgi:hypothetical protein